MNVHWAQYLVDCDVILNIIRSLCYYSRGIQNVHLQTNIVFYCWCLHWDFSIEILLYEQISKVERVTILEWGMNLQKQDFTSFDTKDARINPTNWIHVYECGQSNSPKIKPSIWILQCFWGEIEFVNSLSRSTDGLCKVKVPNYQSSQTYLPQLKIPRIQLEHLQNIISCKILKISFNYYNASDLSKFVAHSNRDEMWDS